METVKSKILDKIRENTNRPFRNYVKIQPYGTFLPAEYADWNEKFDNFPIRADDVWVVTPAKCGTTWTQELVWCILFGMDSEKAKLPLSRRFPFFEIECLMPKDRDVTDMAEDDIRRPGNNWKYMQCLDVPRTIKSHLPLPLLPKQISSVKPKMILVIRDPRDMCVSYYYHYQKFIDYKGNFDDFVQAYLNDILLHLPYWKQVLEFWQRRHDENVLLLTYEEMKRDLSTAVRRVARFLQKSLTEEEVAALVNHCSFDVMKHNPAANNEYLKPGDDNTLKFMRKGVVGDWKTHLSEEQLKDFKDWTTKNLAGSDFPYYQDY